MRICTSAIFAATVLAASTVHAELLEVNDFNPGLGQLVGCAADPTSDSLWLYASFDTHIRHYSKTGVSLGAVPRPGEGANDVDLEIAPEAITLGRTIVPAGAMLFINGESGVAEIYAIDANSGALLATLVTAFGNSHVVGGAWHPERNSFFLLQDKLGSIPNTIAEINPVTGALINSFSIAGHVSVNFGDMDVEPANGNLLVLSSDEPDITEFTPLGAFVQTLPLPDGVSSLSGIGRAGCDDGWVSDTNGTVHQLAGLGGDLGPADINQDGVVDGADLGLLLGAWEACEGCCPADLNADNNVDGADLGLLLGSWT